MFIASFNDSSKNWILKTVKRKNLEIFISYPPCRCVTYSSISQKEADDADRRLSRPYCHGFTVQLTEVSSSAPHSMHSTPYSAPTRTFIKESKMGLRDEKKSLPFLYFYFLLLSSPGVEKFFQWVIHFRCTLETHNTLSTSCHITVVLIASIWQLTKVFSIFFVPEFLCGML